MPHHRRQCHAWDTSLPAAAIQLAGGREGLYARPGTATMPSALAALARIRARRLQNQRLRRVGFARPENVVDWLGAMQAQEYEPATWALALRMKGAPRRDGIERAFDEGRLLRTHVMRPTWHFVTPESIRWLQALTSQRVQRTMATYNRKLALDQAVLRRGVSVFEKVLRDGRYLTRAELGERLGDAGIEARGIRLAHLAMHGELEAVICSGPRRGRHFTYALVAERAPAARLLDRDEALAELATRFLRSHGPATVRDFVWWSGLASADARRGIAACGAASESIEGLTYWTVASSGRAAAREAHAELLPIYDEYLVAYRDRAAVPHGPSAIPLMSRPQVIFQHAVVVDGCVAGTWRPAHSARGVAVDVTLLRPLARGERGAIEEATERYARFIGQPVTLRIGQ